MHRMEEDLGHDDLVDKEDFRNIQPHLGYLEFKEPSALEHINPAFEDFDNNTEFNRQNHLSQKTNISRNQTDNSDKPPSPARLSGETYGIPTYPVIYSNNGQNGVVQEQVVITKPDGTKIIRTEQCCEWSAQPYRKRQKPLTRKRILILKILSVVALVVYFPLGIPAVFFAFRIQKEFDAGIINGNIDKAQKFAGRAQKLIIFAIMFAILTIVLIVSLVDRLKNPDDDKGSLNNRVYPG